jgi:hypothetical protein
MTRDGGVLDWLLMELRNSKPTEKQKVFGNQAGALLHVMDITLR